MTGPLLDSHEVAPAKEPVPVEIAAIAPGAPPMPVTIAAVEQPKRQEPTVASVDREKAKSEGQRRINFVWETTQSVIALSVTFATLFANVAIALSPNEVAINQISALQSLNVMAALVTGFYFSRTNHQAIGGVGEKEDQQEYRGR